MNQQPGSLPMYLRITEFLVREIAAGRLIAGEKLAPERDMAAELGIAVGTLRKALAELQARGMLERVQGSGNYIRAVTDPQSIYAMFRLELVDGGGGLPTAQVLGVDRLPKPDCLPAFGSSSEGHRIRRIRSISGKVAALEEIWLDGALATTVTAADLSESLYLYYRTRLGLWIARAEDRIGLDRMPDWTPDGFPLQPGTPVPHILRTSQTPEGTVPEVSRTWFDPSVAMYVSRLR